MQIVIGGRNKYLINGHVAQPSRVQTMFHSVQLNVNNPHFLIMQGRITKVSCRGHAVASGASVLYAARVLCGCLLRVMPDCASSLATPALQFCSQQL